MTQDNYNRLEKYLTEEMTLEESNAFLNDLKSDDGLREEVQVVSMMIQELRERQAKEDIEIIEEVLATKKKAKTIRMVRWTLSIAAMLILIFGVTQLWNKQSDTDALFNTYYSPYDISSARGADDESIKTELAELYNKVGTDKDVSPVISHLQTIYDNIQSGDENYLDYSDYENDIAWYLALAYIKDHNLEKAKELLNPLAGEGNPEATELLNKIKNL